MRETLMRENGTSHDREVEMAMRVDQTRHEDAIAKVFAFPGGQIAPPAHRNDAAPVEMHVAVLNWRAANGQYDACA